jgi:hypothetical protein
MQGGAVYGHGPGITKIIWDGPAGKRMIHSNGFGRCNWFGLGFDGKGKASVGIDHDSKTYYETRVRYDYCGFANFTDSGIRVGHDQKVASAEIMFYDLNFANCRRGISFLQFNDYDNAIVRNIFRNCGTGVYCHRGNVYVRDSHFENSKEQDILVPPHSHSVRRCTSIGSKAFIKPAQAGKFSLLLAVQDCYVKDWTDPQGAIQLINRGPTIIFDSVFTSKVKSPAISLLNPDKFKQAVIIANVNGKVASDANTHIIKVPRKRDMLITEFADRRWNHRPELPTKIFDAKKFGAKGDGRTDDSTALQKTIDAAQKYGNGAEAYIPSGNYRLTKTLRLKAGNYSIGSSLTWRSRLMWSGTKSQPMITGHNPDGIMVRNLRFNAPKDSGVTSMKVTADKPGVFRTDGCWFGDSRKPSVRGLVLDSLPAGFKVYGGHVNGDTLIRNCGDAFILFDDWYADYEGPFVMEGGTGRGFMGINSAVSSCCNIDMTIKDSSSIVIGDYYTEQTNIHLRATGKPGQTPGRITVSSAKLGARAPDKIQADGYAGQITFTRANVVNYHTKFTGKDDQRLLLLLLGNAFHPNRPEFALNHGKYILLGNLVWNFKNKSLQKLLPDTVHDQAADKAVNNALDHFRELSIANLNK